MLEMIDRAQDSISRGPSRALNKPLIGVGGPWSSFTEDKKRDKEHEIRVVVRPI